MKGSRTLEDATLTIDATTTVNDLIEFVNDTMGIVTLPVNPDGLTPGAQIGPTGVFSVVGNIGELLHEDRAFLGQVVHDVLVVDHLVTHIDGGTEDIERPLDDLDGPIHTCAKSTGIGKDDFHEGCSLSDSGPPSKQVMILNS